MSLEMWLSFFAACMLLCFTPGPTVFLVMGQALSFGKKSVIPLATGVITGDIIAMTFSFLGLGALLAVSAELFSILKWVGAIYLVYLGLKALFAKPTEPGASAIKMNGKSVYWHALIVTALNPKGIVFFLAFFPLFIDASRDAIPQMATMAGTFLFVSLLSVTSYSIFSGVLRSKVTSVKFQSLFNRISGSLLVGAGAITASVKNN